MLAHQVIVGFSEDQIPRNKTLEEKDDHWTTDIEATGRKKHVAGYD